MGEDVVFGGGGVFFADAGEMGFEIEEDVVGVPAAGDDGDGGAEEFDERMVSDGAATVDEVGDVVLTEDAADGVFVMATAFSVEGGTMRPMSR